jgi:GNAT superfamily N-acetyltransferase
VGPALPLPVAGLRTIGLTADRVPALQRFFVDNPEYFLAVNGEPARPDEAHQAVHGDLPPGFGYTKKYAIGYVDIRDALAAMAIVVSDLLAAHVWHIGLFIVETARHGSGDAHALYRALESWAADNGARRMRLGVVQGNARAERFWQRLGYIETRIRTGMEMGKRVNSVRVMVKPLGDETIGQYLELVPRDRP